MGCWTPRLFFLMVLLGSGLMESDQSEANDVDLASPTTQPALRSNRDGLRCRDCALLDYLNCTIQLNAQCIGLSNLETDNERLGLPRQVEAIRYDRIYHTEHGDTTKEGINVTFELPHGFDDKNLGFRGFEVKLSGVERNMGNKDFCHRITFPVGVFTGSRPEQELKIVFDCLFPQYGLYDVSVTTLPSHQDGSTVVIRYKNVGPAPENANLPITADRWEPDVQLTQVASTCMLAVKYNQGPERFAYTHYEVKVLGIYLEYPYLLNGTMVLKQDGNDYWEVIFNVTQLSIQLYESFNASVQPIGPINGTRGRAMHTVNLTGCSNLVPPGTSTPWVVIAPAIAAVVIITLAVGLTITCRVWRGKTLKSLKIRDGGSSREEGNTEPVMEITQIINCKPVLVLYWHDNDDHAKAVYYFCMYLEHQLGCSVSVSLWNNKSVSEDWVLYQMKNSDYVLIVSSEGACQQKSNQALKEKDVLNNQVFVAAMEHIKRSNAYSSGVQSTYDKFFMVTFPYTRQEDLIPELRNKVCCYQLMKDINNLFLAIHGFPEYTPSGHHCYGEGINEREYRHCPEGVELYHALQFTECDSGYEGLNIRPSSANDRFAPRITQETNQEGTKKTEADAISFTSFSSDASTYLLEDKMAENNFKFLTYI